MFKYHKHKILTLWSPIFFVCPKELAQDDTESLLLLVKLNLTSIINFKLKTDKATSF